MNKQRPDSFHRWLMGVLVVAACAWPAAAQDRGIAVYREQLRADMDQQSPEARQMAIDAGGWLNFAYFTYNDTAAHKDRTLREFDLRIWASANINQTHRAYVRGLTSYMDWNSGNNPFHKGDDYNDPIVERAWYEFDLAGMVRAQHKAPDNDLRIKVGRDFTDIGTGFVLATPLDMVRSIANVGDWEWMAMLGKSVPDSLNIDTSPLVRTSNDRWFWGTQVTYKGFDSHEPFAYFLSNQDNQDRHTAAQKYEYTSQYVGLGSKGNLILPNLKYQTELVGEWGDTSSWGSTGRDPIQAWAYDALLEYYFKVRTHPKAMVEFIHASGDGDRAFSSTNTIGGNRPNTADHAFNAFGFRDTGVSLAPAVSNLNIYIMGASFFPLESHKFFRKMEVGVRSYWYQKATGGAISDSTATDGGRYVGWEGDVFVDWRITSDLTLTVRYGGFIPGSAYGDGFKDCRNFFFTGVSYSF